MKRRKYFLAVISFYPILFLFKVNFAQLPIHYENFYNLQDVNFKGAGVIQIWMGEVPGKPKYFWVLGQEGTLWSLYPTNNGEYEKQQLFDIGSRVPLQLSSEYGSYDVAFNPNFINNKKFYVLTMAYRDLSNKDWSNSDLVLEEWVASGNLYQNVTFTKEIMRIPHSRRSFGTSSMIFGPDGYLYLSISDYYRSGWDLSDLARKVLRIDINSSEDGKEYSIPADNPYVNDPDKTIRTEIWASGFRNGWSMTFSPQGDLWLGDVGQWQNEEINLVKPGLNYGWRDGGDGWPEVRTAWEQEFGIPWANQSRGFSGFCSERDYNPTVLQGIDCKDFEDPMWRFKNRVAAKFTIDCIIVGPVVNGDSSDPLHGKLLFADNTTSHIFAVDPHKPTPIENDPTKGPTLIADLSELGNQTHNGIVGFSEDAYGNIYVVLNSWNANIKHELYKLTGLKPRSTVSTSTPRKKFDLILEAKLQIFSSLTPFNIPKGAQTVKLYSVKGDLVWGGKVSEIEALKRSQQIVPGIYNVIYQ